MKTIVFEYVTVQTSIASMKCSIISCLIVWVTLDFRMLKMARLSMELKLVINSKTRK